METPKPAAEPNEEIIDPSIEELDETLDDDGNYDPNR